MMGGKITAHLPSRDFAATEAFYHRLGFKTLYRGDGWMILMLDGMIVEFFPHPELDPETSWFSAGLRLPDIDAQHAKWSGLGLPSGETEIPRLTEPFSLGGDVPRMFAMIDPDGSLWRVMESQEGA